MSNFKISLKAVSIVTAVYGWFIPLAFIPPFERDYQTIEITEDLPEAIQLDFESLFPDAEIIDDSTEPQEEEEETTENMAPAPSKSTPKQSKPTQEKKEAPIPEATNDIDLSELATETLSTSHVSMHPLDRSKLRQKQRKTKAKKRKKTKRCNPQNPNIQLTSRSKTEASYTLPKSLVSHYSSNWKEANRLASLAWATNRSGDIKGVKIRHIYCQSPLRHSGLKKGDIVLAVNGKSVNSNASLIKLFPRVRFWKEIELDVLRKGKSITLKYDVVKGA